MSTDFRALCAELVDALLCWQTDGAWIDQAEQSRLIARTRAALDAQPEPVPTDEELISPIMWMIDDCVYDNDKGDIAENLRELIARWGTPANNTGGTH